MGSSSNPVLALKYALEMSMADIWILRSDLTSQIWDDLPSIPVLADEMIVLNDSNGGVGAKIDSSPGYLI